MVLVFIVGSEQIRATIERDGYSETFSKVTNHFHSCAEKFSQGIKSSELTELAVMFQPFDIQIFCKCVGRWTCSCQRLWALHWTMGQTRYEERSVNVGRRM